MSSLVPGLVLAVLAVAVVGAALRHRASVANTDALSIEHEGASSPRVPAPLEGVVVVVDDGAGEPVSSASAAGQPWGAQEVTVEDNEKSWDST